MTQIIEKAKKVVVPKIEVREHLHGHTTIELRNVRTGKVERIEHKNHFTDGIASYMRDLGAFQNSPYSNGNVRGDKIWKTLLGGILLFDTALPTSPDAKYMPAGTKMTANGAYGVSNNATPSELGSFNAVESTESENSISCVYDWSTSQGNGQIASVALTTSTGGYIGYGNPSGGQASSKYQFDRNQTYLTLNAASGKKRYNAIEQGSYLYYNENLYIPVYASNTGGIPTGSTSIKIRRLRLNVSSVDVFTYAPYADDDSYDEEIEVTVPALPYNYLVRGFGDIFPHTMVAIPTASSWTNGTTITLYFIDVLTGNVTSKTITNNTGVVLGYPSTTGGFIDSTHFVCTKNNVKNEQYIININDSTNESLNVPQVHSNDFSGTNPFGDLYVPLGATNSIYDPVNKTLYPTNGWLAEEGNGRVKMSQYDETDDLLACMQVTNNRVIWLMKNPLRLMTINNLDSAVTKTADKTMKVTYTVTRA